MKNKLPKRIKIIPQGPKCLFLNTGRAECSIVDESDNAVTVEEAKRLWESGTIEDFNLALRRLATMEWDYEALKRYYAEGGRRLASTVNSGSPNRTEPESD